MINTQNLNEENYNKLRFELINQLETSNRDLLNPIIDTVGKPTIGIGLNLTDENSRNIVFDIFGIDRKKENDLAYANQLITIIDKNWNGGQEAQLIRELNAILAKRAQDPLVTAPNKRQSFAFQNRDESIQAFSQLVQPKETLVNGRVANFPQSWERAVLFSLAYTNLTLIGAGLRGAITDGDRQEAWYEIRYNSNGGNSRAGGVAKRRYVESEIFGLYDQSNPPADFSPPETDALKVFRMYNKHENKINHEETEFGTAKEIANGDITAINGRLAQTGIVIGQVQTPQEEFDSAKTVLVNNFATLPENVRKELKAIAPQSFLLTPEQIDGVFVAAATNAPDEVATHTVDRSNKEPKQKERQDDLIFGGIDERRGDNDVSGGNDTLIGAGGNDLFIGGLGADSHNGGDEIDTISYLRSPVAVTVDLNAGTGKGGHAEGDSYENIENIIGSPQGDTLTGNNLVNLVLGLAGNDSIDGGAGNDTILGNEGQDTLKGGDGNDEIIGGPEDQKIQNKQSKPNLAQIAVIDNDSLDGGNGNFDRMFGGKGNDTITDPDGILGAHGGTGNDRIDVNFAAAWDNDANSSNGSRSDGKITGGYGDDIITVEMNNNRFFINLKGDEPVNSFRDGNDVIELSGKYQYSVVDLGGGTDIFIGGGGSDNVSGKDGNDAITGLGGNDRLAGNEGNDTLMGGAGRDTFILAADNSKDTVMDFTDNQDLIGLSGGLSFSDLTIGSNSSGTLLTIANTSLKLSSSTIEVFAVLHGTESIAISADDFITV